MVSGNIWNIDDVLSISLGKRNKDLWGSLGAYSPMAFPIFIVSISITSPVCAFIPFVCWGRYQLLSQKGFRECVNIWRNLSRDREV